MADALGTFGAGPNGVVTAQEHRLALTSLVAGLSSGILDARTGVFPGPNSLALVTGTSATAPMTVAIAVHQAATARTSAQGLYLGPTLEAPTTVNIAAAPASNSRIDVVYVKQQDADSAVLTPEASTAPVWGVVTGTASATPVKPAIPVGALELATVTVASTATATNGPGVTISNTVRQTVANGGIVPARSGDTTAGAYVGAYRDDPTAWLQRWNGSSWGTPNPVSDTGWVNLTPAPGWSAVTTNGDPGLRYRIRGSLVEVTLHITHPTTTWAVGAKLFTLPAAAVPAATTYIRATKDATDGVASAMLYISTGGDCFVNVGGTANSDLYATGMFFVG